MKIGDIYLCTHCLNTGHRICIAKIIPNTYVTNRRILVKSIFTNTNSSNYKKSNAPFACETKKKYLRKLSTEELLEL